MQVTVRKWGNSASVRIPAGIMEAAHLSLDQAVDIREEAGRIIIEPMKKPKVDINALIDSITDENRHEEIGWGQPVGREVW